MSSIPSKDIREYLEAKLSDLRADTELTFSVYLFFSGNSHIMLWRMTGDSVSNGFLEKYQGRGVERIWIHSSDAAAFEAYRNPAQAESATLPAEVEGAFVEEPTPEEE